MEKCKYCALKEAKPCYECSLCMGGDSHFKSRVTKSDESINAIKAMQQENEQLEAQILAGVVDSDLVKTYDGSALDRADQYIERLEKQNEELRAQAARMATTLREVKKILTLIDECGNEWEAGTASEGLTIIAEVVGK